MVGFEIVGQAPQRTAPVLGFFAGGASAAVPADEARTGVWEDWLVIFSALRRV